METSNFTEQCVPVEPIQSDQYVSMFFEENEYIKIENDIKIQNDEPIDLTTFNHEFSDCIPHENNNECSLDPLILPSMKSTNNDNIEYFTIPNNNFVKKKRGKLSGDNQINNTFVLTGSSPVLSESRYEEVLKAAKSLFSKRTRTLYHWMHPNASKQQIKFLVANSWESLQPTEKEFYLSQVMEKFGLVQGSLMVNPQLSNMNKVLPVVPKIVPQYNAKAKELQDAISSISIDNNDHHNGIGDVCVIRDTFSMNNYQSDLLRTEKSVRKRGRPSKSSYTNGSTSTTKRKFEHFEFIDLTNQDFQDDPELSQELAQFANIMKNKIN